MGKLLEGRPLSAEQRGQVQELLNQAGKGAPHPRLHEVAPDRLFYEPDVKSERAQGYARLAFPHTIEIVGHACQHASIRLGDRWVDIHHVFENGNWDQTQMETTVRRLDKPGRAAAAIELYKGQEREGWAVGFSLPASRSTIRKLYRAYRRLPARIPFDWVGANAKENCLSMTTRILQEHAPELGVPRLTNTREFFSHFVKTNPKVAMVSYYSNDDRAHLGDADELQALGHKLFGPDLAPLLAP